MAERSRRESGEQEKTDGEQGEEGTEEGDEAVMKLARVEGRELPHRDQHARLVNDPRRPSSRSKTEGNGDGSHDQVRYSLQQLLERRKERLSNTYRTPQQARCASVLQSRPSSAFSTAS